MGKPLDECSKEELVEIIKSQKETISRTKKFGLVWEDKPEKVATDCAEKLPVIREVPERILVKNNDFPTDVIIEGDNYHALSVLNYTHSDSIDVIYIDPPYNTGARDWKYNNDYVDTNDVYRHSKWLAMMDKRLQLAKNLLKKDTGVLIVTIDENEVHHVRCLLEQLFPECTIQMVTCVVNPKGIFQGKLTRVEEYIIFCFMPQAHVCQLHDSMLGLQTGNAASVRWKGLLRSGSKAKRSDNKNEFYPILIDEKTNKVIKALDPVPLGEHPDLNKKIDGYTAVYPIRSDGSEGIWGVTGPTLNRLIEQGYVALGRYDEKRNTYGLSFLTSGLVQQIESGDLIITSRDPITNVVSVEYKDNKMQNVKTVWHRTRHDAGAYGSDLLTKILKDSQTFSFPKSLYSEVDTLKVVLSDNPNAVVLDFFAGSGTTLHAVNLINAQDGGKRSCILSTNNELSEKEAKELTKKGFKPGDVEWDRLGIAQHVTWPRSKCVVNGVDIDDKPLEGEYIDTEIPMAQGFDANIRYFKTDFIDKNDTMDKLRRELSPACEDMIRVREGAYEKIIDDDMLKVFKNSRGLTAIIYDRFELAEHIEKIEALDTDAPVHLYVFSYSKSDRKDEMPNGLKHKYEAQPIPEGVLEIYKKIFANIKGGKNA